MSKETASFALQGNFDESARFCIGSELKDKAEHLDTFAVQQNSPTAQKWTYEVDTTTNTIEWGLQDWSEIESDLGLTPNPIPVQSFEMDMWMAPDFTIYLVYYQYLLKSTDGFTWEIVNDDLPFHAKGHELAVDWGYHTECSYIDGNVFVMMQGYVYKSSDNGVTWKEVCAVPSDYADKRNARVKKAFDKASGQTMLFFGPGYSHKTYSKFYYSLDEGETWTLFSPYIAKGRFIEWHDSKQVFLVLSVIQNYNQLLSIPMASFISNDQNDYNLVADVFTGSSNDQEALVVTPELIFVTHSSGAAFRFILDNDYNIVCKTTDPDPSWIQPRHCTYVQYDPYADDVLCGVHMRKANSTSRPQNGRYHLSELKKGNYLVRRGPNMVNDVADTATMVYHPLTKRYYQASRLGVRYSFEQKPGDFDFLKKEETIVTQNLDEINDDALLCCTDTDGVTYSVTGAQFKELMTLAPPPKPWEGHDGGIFHIKNVQNAEIVLIDYGPASFKGWDPDGTNERAVRNIAIGEEVVFITSKVCTNLFAYNSKATWDFGEFTDTSKVKDMSIMFGFAEAFNSDISNWDVSSVTNMDYMLQYAWEFDQDISNWCVTNIKSKPEAFDWGTVIEDQDDKQPQWGTCP